MIETIHDQRRRLDNVLDKWETKSVKEGKNTFAYESRILKAQNAFVFLNLTNNHMYLSYLITCASILSGYVDHDYVI